MPKCTEKPEHANIPAFCKITGEGLSITPCKPCYLSFVAADPKAEMCKIPNRRWKRIELIQRDKTDGQ